MLSAKCRSQILHVQNYRILAVLSHLLQVCALSPQLAAAPATAEHLALFYAARFADWYGKRSHTADGACRVDHQSNFNVNVRCRPSQGPALKGSLALVKHSSSLPEAAMLQLFQAFQREVVVSELPQAIRMAAMQLLDSTAQVSVLTLSAH